MAVAGGSAHRARREAPRDLRRDGTVQGVEVSADTAAAVLTHIVRSIVDDPDAVRVESTSVDGRDRLEVRVGPGDLGRVIGGAHDDPRLAVFGNADAVAGGRPLVPWRTDQHGNRLDAAQLVE